MRRVDVLLSLLVSGLFAGVGAILASLGIKYATHAMVWDVVLWGGVFLIVLSVANLILLLWASSSPARRMRPLWGPMILIDLGLCLIVGGIIWHINDAPEKELQGFASYAVIRLYDSPEFRRRYVYEFVTSDGAKTAFYLSGTGQFTFQVTDVHGEAYPIEVQVGGSGLPIDRWIALFCEVGVGKNSTRLSIVYNGHQVAQRDVPTEIPLGKMDWHAGSLGAPTVGANQGGIFMLFEIGVFPATITRLKKALLVENISKFLQQPFD